VQSGPLFHAKTRALEKALAKQLPEHTLSLHYPTGHLALSPADQPSFFSSSSPEPHDVNSNAFGWWRRDTAEPLGPYLGFEEGLEQVAGIVRDEGPFDGVVGFSQGAALAAMLASLLEDGSEREEAFRRRKTTTGGMAYPASFLKEGERGRQRVHPPLRFWVAYSGFRAESELYQAFYEPKIRTRALLVLGTLDTVLPIERVEALADVCVEGREAVVEHAGAHYVPCDKRMVGVLAGFIRNVVGQEGKGRPKEDDEVAVEDMDVPF
jgi:hypothetical protein